MTNEEKFWKAREQYYEPPDECYCNVGNAPCSFCTTPPKCEECDEELGENEVDGICIKCEIRLYGDGKE